MSRAFVREDVDPPERSGRTRSPSGLPPGATNYISARGAQRLRDKLTQAQARGESGERAAELANILASVAVVDPPNDPSREIGFGSTVTVEAGDGATRTFTVVGVDELGFEPDGLIWVSPLGKTLLAAELGDRVMVGEEKLGTIVKVEYRSL